MANIKHEHNDIIKATKESGVSKYAWTVENHVIASRLGRSPIVFQVNVGVVIQIYCTNICIHKCVCIKVIFLNDSGIL